jgi:hypothetical protein
VKVAAGPDATGGQRVIKAYVFYMSPANVTVLRTKCLEELGEAHISINDVICALVWRCLLKSRTAAGRHEKRQPA